MDGVTKRDWFTQAAVAALASSHSDVERWLKMAYDRAIRDAIARIERCDGPMNSFYVSQIVDLSR